MTSYDRHRRFGESGSSAFDGPIRDPGKRSGMQPAQRKATEWPGKRSISQDLRPIQRQPAPLDPTTVQVDQYAQGTAADRFNDCGPAVVLMVIRSLGAEPALDKRVAVNFDTTPDAVTVQQRLIYLRGWVANADDPATARKKDPKADVDTPLEVSDVESLLFKILPLVGVTIPEAQLRTMIVAVGDQKPVGSFTVDQDAGADPSKPSAKGAAKAFLDANCGGGSAVIVLGKPTAAAWGWGGEDDPSRRQINNVPQDIPDRGKHFVYVWSPSQDVYTVMDPSWQQPIPNITFAQIEAFMAGEGGSSLVNMIKVPFEQIAASIPKQAKLAGAPTVRPAAAIGGGSPLPAPTRARMEHGFFTSFSDVRVHEGDTAPAIGARAFAQGSDLHFAPGEYRPGSPDGDRLIGHELAHVVQQREGRVAASGDEIVTNPALEAEADTHGDRVASGGVVGSEQAAPQTAEPAIQRDPGDKPTDTAPVGVIPADKITAITAAHRGFNGNAGDATAYGQAVMAVWSYCDQNVPVTSEVTAYAQAPGDSQLKLDTIGRMAAARAHLEFLIGWMLQGGIQIDKSPPDTANPKASTTGDWENTPNTTKDNTTNRGTIVDRYTNAAAGYGISGNDWCGMFVGYVLSREGLVHATQSSGPTDHSELASAYKILARLRDGTRKVDSQERVLSFVGDIPSTMTAPQPGDVVVFPDHVSMVESYDASSQTLDTVDGNVGLRVGTDADDSVSGTSYTLPQTDTAPRKILVIWRPGLEAYGGMDNAATTDNSEGERHVAQIQAASAQIAALYAQLGLPGAVTTGTVATIAASSK